MQSCNKALYAAAAAAMLQAEHEAAPQEIAASPPVTFTPGHARAPKALACKSSILAVASPLRHRPAHQLQMAKARAEQVPPGSPNAGPRSLEKAPSFVPTPGSLTAPSSVPTPGSFTAPSFVATPGSLTAPSFVATPGSPTVRPRGFESAGSYVTPPPASPPVRPQSLERTPGFMVAPPCSPMVKPRGQEGMASSAPPAVASVSPMLRRRSLEQGTIAPLSPVLGPRGSPRLEFRGRPTSPRLGPRRTNAHQKVIQQTPSYTPPPTHTQEHASASATHDATPGSPQVKPRSSPQPGSVFCFPDAAHNKAPASPRADRHSLTPPATGVFIPGPPRDPNSTLAHRGQSLLARNLTPSQSPLVTGSKISNSMPRSSQSPVRSRGSLLVPSHSPCPGRQFGSMVAVPGHSPVRTRVCTPGSHRAPVNTSPTRVRERRSFVAAPSPCPSAAPTRDIKYVASALEFESLAPRRDSRSGAVAAPARALAWDFASDISSNSGSLLSTLQDIPSVPAQPLAMGCLNSAPGISLGPAPLPCATAQPLGQQFGADGAEMRFTVEELTYAGPCLDPASPALKGELLTKMNVDPNSVIELLRQEGGQNQGLWALHTPSGTLILKLASGQRQHPCLPTEAEQYIKLATEWPSIMQDRALTFPLKVFKCHRLGSDVHHDLVVMRKASGDLLSDVIGRKWQAGQVMELMSVFEASGRFLAGVHKRHAGMQHGDCTASNMFYDEATGSFTLVDVSDFGPQSWRSREPDVEHFLRGLELMSVALGAQLYSEGRRHFESGYHAQTME